MPFRPRHEQKAQEKKKIQKEKKTKKPQNKTKPKNKQTKKSLPKPREMQRTIKAIFETSYKFHFEV